VTVEVRYYIDQSLTGVWHEWGRDRDEVTVVVDRAAPRAPAGWTLVADEAEQASSMESRLPSALGARQVRRVGSG